jgi:hypothetical protein
LIDIKMLLDLPARIVTFDSVDEVRHFAPDEAEFVVADLATQCTTVVGQYQPDFLFVDCHHPAVLTEVIRRATDVSSGIHCLAIHDCGRGLCNPSMPLARGDPAVTSATGVWERHVLAEIFGLAEPLDARLDDWDAPSCHLTIFDTTHGLGVITARP